LKSFKFINLNWKIIIYLSKNLTSCHIDYIPKPWCHVAFWCPLHLHSNFCDQVVMNIVKFKIIIIFLTSHKTQDVLLWFWNKNLSLRAINGHKTHHWTISHGRLKIVFSIRILSPGVKLLICFYIPIKIIEFILFSIIGLENNNMYIQSSIKILYDLFPWLPFCPSKMCLGTCLVVPKHILVLPLHTLGFVMHNLGL